MKEIGEESYRHILQIHFNASTDIKKRFIWFGAWRKKEIYMISRPWRHNPI